MRYLSAVSDWASETITSHLTPSELRLSGTLAQPKRLAIGCIVLLTALGGLALGLIATDFQPAWQALCRPASGAGWAELALAVPMWAAMVLVMMLPTAGPMVLTYADIADTAAGKGEPAVSPLVLTAGYVAVWLGFAVAAGSVQWVVARAGLLEVGQVKGLAAGTLFLAAGLYQFSTLKQACLSQCQRPFPFFFANWTAEPAGVFRLGLRQGLFCLGCCWAMMLVMFASGAMNVIWMAALGIVMTVEKLSTTPRFSRVLGGLFVAAGSTMMIFAVM
jgi:predicted metal-binding membrane protein